MGIYTTHMVRALPRKSTLMSRPYWKTKLTDRKFYKLSDAKKFGNDIEKATGVRPTFTYHRMLAGLWVRTEANV